MDRTPVTSLTLRSAGYDQAQNLLELEFKTGGIYQYSDVPFEVYEGLISSPDPKEFFKEHIKTGGYDCEKIK